jgi:hypothetical protein
MNDFNLGVDKDQLVDLYKYCTQDRKDFLMVDIDVPMEQRFRKCFLQVLTIHDESSSSESESDKEEESRKFKLS